jgi:hypothetical protein
MLESEGPSPDLARAYVWISILHSVTGEVEACREVATKGLSIADSLGLNVARSHLLTSLGLSEALSGDRGGLDRIHQALNLAEQSGETEAIGRAYLSGPGVSHRRGAWAPGGTVGRGAPGDGEHTDTR